MLHQSWWLEWTGALPAVMPAKSPFDTIFGLPVHVLVVHAVVVLLPLTAFLALLMAIRAEWSRRLGPLAALGAFICTGAALVASKSGEQLQSRVDIPAFKALHAQIATHALIGRQVKYVAGLLLLAVVATWWLDRRSADGGRRLPANRAVGAVAAVVAVASVIWTVRAGDSGARAVWQGTIQHTQPGTFPHSSN